MKATITVAPFPRGLPGQAPPGGSPRLAGQPVPPLVMRLVAGECRLSH